jgi:cell division protein FtsX
MNFAIGEEKQIPTTLLPLDKQVHITLETQEEINQLFAMLNYTPIVDALNMHNNDWHRLKQILDSNDGYLDWHARLCNNED